MKELSAEMEGIGRQMEALDGRMQGIGARMDLAGERMEERAWIAGKETRKLLEE